MQLESVGELARRCNSNTILGMEVDLILVDCSVSIAFKADAWMEICVHKGSRGICRNI